MIQIPVLVLLKISPLVFALLIEIFPIDFGQKLRGVIRRYRGAGPINENDVSLAVYAHDWFESKSILIISFIYTDLLFLSAFVETVQAGTPQYWLLAPIVFFLFFSGLSVYFIDGWFSITDTKHPDHYYLHYYTDKSLGELRDVDAIESDDTDRSIDELIEVVEAETDIDDLIEVYPPSLLSIRWLTRYVELGLIISIVVLDTGSGTDAIIAVTGVMVGIVLLGILSFFWEELYPLRRRVS